MSEFDIYFFKWVTRIGNALVFFRRTLLYAFLVFHVYSEFLRPSLQSLIWIGVIFWFLWWWFCRDKPKLADSVRTKVIWFIRVCKIIFAFCEKWVFPIFNFYFKIQRMLLTFFFRGPFIVSSWIIRFSFIFVLCHFIILWRIMLLFSWVSFLVKKWNDSLVWYQIFEEKTWWFTYWKYFEYVDYLDRWMDYDLMIDISDVPKLSIPYYDTDGEYYKPTNKDFFGHASVVEWSLVFVEDGLKKLKTGDLVFFEIEHFTETSAAGLVIQTSEKGVLVYILSSYTEFVKVGTIAYGANDLVAKIYFRDYTYIKRRRFLNLINIYFIIHLFFKQKIMWYNFIKFLNKLVRLYFRIKKKSK